MSYENLHHLLPERGLMSEYDTNEYDKDREELAERIIPSGFGKQLDENLKLMPGIYLVGAIPSMGKSSWCWQLALNLAKGSEKQPVMYFSCEQAKRSMETKALSLLMKQDNPKTALTSKQILEKKAEKVEPHKAAFEVARSKFREIGTRLSVYRERKIDYICALIEREVKIAKEEGNFPPIVFVDYLQILREPAGRKQTSAKEHVDYMVSELSMMQAKYDLLIVAISSFNRTSYYSPVTIDSGKDSGDLEFDVDVMLGLQYTAFKGKSASEAKYQLNEEKKNDKRAITLVCVKDRENSNGAWEQNFTFEPAYSYFEIVKPGPKKDNQSSSTAIGERRTVSDEQKRMEAMGVKF